MRGGPEAIAVAGPLREPCVTNGGVRSAAARISGPSVALTRFGALSGDRWFERQGKRCFGAQTRIARHLLASLR